MTYNWINNIPRDWLVGEFLLDWNWDDTSWNWNNGTATDVTWISADRGYVKECWSFNGSSSKVDVPDNLLDWTIFSVSVIISDKWNSSDTDWKIIDFRNSWKDNYFVFFHQNADGTIQLAVDFWTSNQVKIWNVNEWYKHYWFTRNWDTLKIYKEWILINTLSVWTNSFTGASWMIWQESDDWAARHFNWDIWLVRIYNSVITPSEINSLYIEWLRKLWPWIMQQYPELFKGCVWYFDFREWNLSNLIDWINWSLNWNDITLVADNLGYPNSAYHCVLTDWNYIDLWSNIPSDSNTFTVWWVYKITNADNWGQLVSQWWTWTDNCKFQLTYYNNTFRFIVHNWTTLYKADSWVGIDWNTHSYFWIFDWTTAKIYIDWIEKWSVDVDWSNNINDNMLISAYQWWDTYNIEWDVSCFYWFNRALSDQKLKQLHNLLMEKYIYPNPRYTPQSLPKPVLYINWNNNWTTWYDSSWNWNNATSSWTPFNIWQLKWISLSSQDMTWNDTWTIWTSTCYENISWKWTFMKNPSYITSTWISSTTKDLVNIRIFSETLSDKQIQELYYAEKWNFIN